MSAAGPTIARVAAMVLALGAGVTACTPAASSDGACTCAANEKFDGDACVAEADFEAPTDCTDDGTAVCGCDGEGYASECAAFEAGVQVKNNGQCSTAGGGGGGGGGGW